MSRYEHQGRVQEHLNPVMPKRAPLTHTRGCTQERTCLRRCVWLLATSSYTRRCSHAPRDSRSVAKKSRSGTVSSWCHMRASLAPKLIASVRRVRPPAAASTNVQLLAPGLSADAAAACEVSCDHRQQVLQSHVHVRAGAAIDASMVG